MHPKIDDKISRGTREIMAKHTDLVEARRAVGEKVPISLAMLDQINAELDTLFRAVEAQFKMKIPFAYRARKDGPERVAIMPVVLN